MVPRGRLELPLLSKTDFESAASTDSATEALWARSIGRRPGVVNRATGMASGLRQAVKLATIVKIVGYPRADEIRWGRGGCSKLFAVGLSAWSSRCQ